MISVTWQVRNISQCEMNLKDLKMQIFLKVNNELDNVS